GRMSSATARTWSASASARSSTRIFGLRIRSRSFGLSEFPWSAGLPCHVERWRADLFRLPPVLLSPSIFDREPETVHGPIERFPHSPKELHRFRGIGSHRAGGGRFGPAPNHLQIVRWDYGVIVYGAPIISA